jgi:hypothetical protein
VFARGDVASSRFNGVSRGPKLPLSLKSDYDAQVLGLYPQALYINQDKVSGSDGGNVWVFSTVQQRPLLIGKHEVSRLAFTQLEGTSLWTAVIKPRVDAESAAWERQRQERIQELIQESDGDKRARAKAFRVPGYE